MSTKFHLSKWKTYFSQVIDNFLKIEKVEYLSYYVKLKMWPALFYVNSLCFPNSFEFCWQAVHYFPQFTQRLATGILSVALARLFNFSHDERDKKLEFSRLDPAW